MTSLEQRDQIKQLMNQGLQAPEIAKQLGISVHTVRKWGRIIKKGAPFTRLWGDPKRVR